MPQQDYFDAIKREFEKESGLEGLQSEGKSATPE